MAELKIHSVSDDLARQMLIRAEAAKMNTYPIPNKGYAVTVLTDRGNIYEGHTFLTP